MPGTRNAAANGVSSGKAGSTSSGASSKSPMSTVSLPTLPAREIRCFIAHHRPVSARMASVSWCAEESSTSESPARMRVSPRGISV